MSHLPLMMLLPLKVCQTRAIAHSRTLQQTLTLTRQLLPSFPAMCTL